MDFLLVNTAVIIILMTACGVRPAARCGTVGPGSGRTIGLLMAALGRHEPIDRVHAKGWNRRKLPVQDRIGEGRVSTGLGRSQASLRMAASGA
jgi:hypothetical protein